MFPPELPIETEEGFGHSDVDGMCDQEDGDSNLTELESDSGTHT